MSGQRAEKGVALLWRSADGVGELPMGTYATAQEALAAIAGARAELLAQGTGDDADQADIHAGRWVVVLTEED